MSIDEVGCVTDGAGYHGGNEKSEMKILADGLLWTQFMDTGDCFVYTKYDYLQVSVLFLSCTVPFCANPDLFPAIYFNYKLPAAERQPGSGLAVPHRGRSGQFGGQGGR